MAVTYSTKKSNQKTTTFSKAKMKGVKHIIHRGKSLNVFYTKPQRYTHKKAMLWIDDGNVCLKLNGQQIHRLRTALRA